ncbi:Alpha/Beta hydrolase protein [Gautieria morchelliformis]|nr:Alpha/Beta hydrolase protein [Gautieria morchelliformis]
MPRIPVVGRLFLHEYTSLLLGFSIIVLEAVIRVVTIGLPAPVLSWFYDRSRKLFNCFKTPESHTSSRKRALVECIRTATNFESLCGIFGYYPEEHIVQTRDGFMLGIHRIPNKKGEKGKAGRKGRSVGKPVVYLHHGLLMNSEVWVCLTAEERALPFVLAENGYDVWLGNNRGNKYSKKHTIHNPSSIAFWDFSIDDFCLYDIPDSIQYVLNTTRAKTLSYIGFSQGTAQAFAALGVHPYLNERVNLFVALAPAMRPRGLAAPIVDALMKASPTLVFLFFGRKSILSSTAMWQSILYPPLFVSVIDRSLGWLFDWRGENITHGQKLAAYAHLFSFASVKSVVHWFQIMRSGEFLMYDDDVHGVLYSRNFYHPAKFPTRNISTPIVLLYGERDSLVDIHTLLTELPDHTIAKGIPKYEHVDVLWGKDVHKVVIPEVLHALKHHCEKPTSLTSLKRELGAESAVSTNEVEVDEDGSQV